MVKGVKVECCTYERLGMLIMNKIELKNIEKRIKNNLVLDDISIVLESGKIYGFVGINGSGKSMLFRLIAGLIRPTKGSILINNKELYKEIKHIENVGIVLENKNLIMDLTGKENLQYLAKINRKINDDQIDYSIKRVGLDPSDKKIIKKYSLGMKQKIVIAQAIMEKPDYLLLDEPTNALDEKSVEMIRNIILEEKQRGAMVLIASHNREDIECLCDEVFTVEEGKVSKRK